MAGYTDGRVLLSAHMNSFIHFFAFFVVMRVSEQETYIVTFCRKEGMKVLLLQIN